MLRSYLTLAWRNLRQHRSYMLLNVGGLAIGLTCCLLIALYVQHELSYDRFHEKADRIYRVASGIGVSGTEAHFARTGAPVAAVLRSTFPEVEQAVRLLPSRGIIQIEEQRFSEDLLYFADSTLFDVFTLPLLAGEADRALAAPYSVVLTHSTARRYFGERDPVAETILIDGDSYTVTGVMEDIPAASHFHFDLAASLSTVQGSGGMSPDAWVSGLNYATYVLLRPGASAGALARKLPPLLETNVGEILRNFNAMFVLHLQPLPSIHLHSKLDYELEPTSDILYIYIFITVALFILLIACINFVNLSTARSMDRAREVGVRKVMGADRRQLIRQFLAEAVLLSAVALVLALALASAFLPVFNELSGRTLHLWSGGTTLLFLVALVLLVGLGAGSYPAFYLSAFRPAQVLKGTFRTGKNGAAFRRVLVVCQFAISIVLLTGMLLVQRQLHYAQTERLGFSREHVLILPIHQDEQLFERQKAFKQEVQQSPTVTSAALSDHYPGGPTDDWVMIPEGRSDEEGIHFWAFRSDFDLLGTLGMELASGRDFDPALPTDSSALLVNETAARMLGWTDQGEHRLVELEGAGPDGRVTKPVIGIVRDFHFESFRHAIRPLVVRPDLSFDYLLVRVQGARLAEALAFLKQKWAGFTSETPFSYTFLDEEFDALYQADRRLSHAFGYFAGLAVFIACLGLFGLATHTAEQRTKEIGIRKALGASVASIVALLSKDLLRLVLIGFIAACPIAYVAMHEWLEGFAYRVEIGPDVFLLAGLLALVIAVATVSYQAVRAALADPVESLRNE